MIKKERSADNQLSHRAFLHFFRRDNGCPCDFFYFLKDEGLITDETEGYILSLADKNEEIRASYFKTINEEKEKGMWAEHKKINDKANT